MVLTAARHRPRPPPLAAVLLGNYEGRPSKIVTVLQGLKDTGLYSVSFGSGCVSGTDGIKCATSTHFQDAVTAASGAVSGRGEWNGLTTTESLWQRTSACGLCVRLRELGAETKADSPGSPPPGPSQAAIVFVGGIETSFAAEGHDWASNGACDNKKIEVRMQQRVCACVRGVGGQAGRQVAVKSRPAFHCSSEPMRAYRGSHRRRVRSLSRCVRRAGHYRGWRVHHHGRQMRWEGALLAHKRGVQSSRCVRRCVPPSRMSVLAGRPTHWRAEHTVPSLPLGPYVRRTSRPSAQVNGLPGCQLQLLQAIRAAYPTTPIVTVLITGNPM